MTDKILVFIPIYNCKNQIGRVLTQLKSQVADYIDEVIIIDNRSQDTTVENAVTAAKTLNGVKISVLQNDKNYGYGGSVKVAINYAIENGFAYLLVLHGDDQADINDFMTVLKTKSYQQSELTMGARFHPDSKFFGYSKFLIFCNRVLNFICTILSGHKIYDLGSGLNIYKISAISSLPYAHLPNDLTFDPHLISQAIDKGFSITYAPISWRSDDQVSNAKAFRQGIKIIWLFLRGKSYGDSSNNTADMKSYSYQVVYSKNAQ